MSRTLSIGATLLLALAAAEPSFSDPSTTPSQVPSDNGVVKSGDVIIWKVNKPITLQPATQSSAAKQPVLTTPTAGDTAAAALAVKASADKLAKAATPPTAGATADDVAKSKAANAAAAAAATAVLQANSDAFVAGASKDSSATGTRAALATVVRDADQSNTLAKDAIAADAQARTDEQAAADAAKRAAQPGASQSDRDAAQKASDKANQSRQTANEKSATAHAYLAAAADALVTFDTTTPITPTSSTTATRADDQVCFPANSLFEVTNVVAATNTANKPQDATTVASNTQLVAGSFSSQRQWLHWFHFHTLPNTPPPGADTPPGNAPPSACGSDVKRASYDTPYEFTSEQLSKQDFYRLGFTWGALVIPYKFYLTDRSIKSNTSTVAYAGYEGWLPGLSLSTVLAIGPGLTTSSTTTPNTPATGNTTPSGTTTKSSTFVTYTVAIGFIAAFGDSKNFKVGFMFGRDYQGKDSGFQYENKNWLALSVGVGI